jgi:dipeptidyl aminopeptidase/acylaminoacyl peptidase
VRQHNFVEPILGALAGIENLKKDYSTASLKRKVEGRIVKPPDFDPAKKYPLILEIHGGPFANYGDRFDTNKQIWAAKGFVVVYINPRGSTSYGEEFANLAKWNRCWCGFQVYLTG